MKNTRWPLYRGVTIDKIGSQDLDDGFSLVKEGEDYYLDVFVSMASVLARPDTRSNRRAYQYGFTRYYPNFIQHMLPTDLSENKLSLLYGKYRKVYRLSVHLDRWGEVKRYEVEPAVFRNEGQYSYKGVSKILEQPKHKHHALLRDALELATLLYRRRLDSGALALFDIKRGLTINEEGLMVRLTSEESHYGYLIVQEYMILTNYLMSRYFIEREIPCLFRNQRAKVIAPERASLLESIQSAAYDAQDSRIETFNQRMELVLETASYHPYLEGHFSLNLPSYMHISSPLRRYADLVNVQQLQAYLTNEPLPYTIDDLVRISQHLEEVYERYRAERRERQKEVERERTKQKLSTSSFGDLEGDAFFQVMQTAFEGGQVTEELIGEIERRLEQRMLIERDMLVLLWRAPNEERFNRIREQIVAELIGYPHRASSLFSLGKLMLKWPEPQLEIKTLEEHKPLRFRARARIEMWKRTFESDEFEFYSKKRARHMALLDLQIKMLKYRYALEIETHLPHTDADFHAELIGEANSKAMQADGGQTESINGVEIQMPEQDYAGILHQFCIMNHWPLPMYEIEMHGPPHQPVFYARGILTVRGKRLESDRMAGKRKQHAKHMAAKSLIDMINQMQFSDMGRPVLIHPVQQLVDYLQSKGIDRPPHFSYVRYMEGDKKGYMCTCSVFLTPDLIVNATEFGFSKNAARNNAAGSVLIKLYRYYDEIAGGEEE